jgi:GTPase SAR1 family protein
MASLTQRSALGQRASIGTFYSAITDTFLPSSLLRSELPTDALTTTIADKINVMANDHDTYQKRFGAMNISPALSASIMAGMVNYKGSSRYLAEPRKERTIQVALHHTVNTITEQMNFSSPGLRECLVTNAINDQRITHVVAGIEWGATSVVAARMNIDSMADAESTKAQFQTDFVTFVSAVESIQNTVPLEEGEFFRTQIQDKSEVTVYSDMLEEDDGILLEGFSEAFEFLQLMPLHIKDEARGKGWPIAYALLPVDMLSLLLQVQITGARAIAYPASDCLESFVQLFDQYQACRLSLNDCELKIATNKQYLPADLPQIVASHQRNLQIAVRRLKTEYAHTLESVRTCSADHAALWTLLSRCQNGELSPHEFGNVGLPGIETAETVREMVDKGAIYIGHNGVPLREALDNVSHDDAYIFYFNSAGIKNDPLWQANHHLMLDILQSRSPKTLAVIYDCDATSEALDKIHVSHYQGGYEVSRDVLEDRIFMAQKCFASCPKATLETENIQPPIQRRHVTIACPGRKCNVAKVQEWLCPRCRAPIEYGFTDQYIYCDCGRSLYSNYEFKCSNDTHGPHYVPCDPDHLLRQLKDLIQTNYLNILILGESGVGKSTFINAMVNYLEFETLDEAIDMEKLNYVIPCSFSTQVMDRSNPDRPIEEKRIEIGARDDEKDGSKGDSATQKTTVYPVTFSSGDSTLTVRLIDTPGIGDSRGVDYDRQNMADILSTISGYDMIHGILILLKSNNSRLTITFRYCVKELLTHLHHSTAANMAFGFTNTRISNYTPGDTYGPLKSLLEQHPGVGLKLETPTTYCFDSESFRYLAAFKSDVHMPNRTDFERSWTQSRDETTRLINHFQSIPPHEVKNTMSLNGARQLISELTKPLAEISQIINTNIQVVEDAMEALKDSRLRGDQLRNSLHVQKIQMNSEQLDRPRTVCAHSSCIEVQDDGKGQNNRVIVYKSHCHSICYLDGVEHDKMAHPGLIDCVAFSGNTNCLQCSHHWQQHLHVMYELFPETVTVIDSRIEQQLNNHADDITLKQTAISLHNKRVTEYKQEQETIRDTAAKFCIFLKNNSLVPYNDALIAYLDFLIKEEQAKVQAGGNNKRLLSLTEERHKHQEAIELITRNMTSNATWNDLSEGAVDRMVQGLYSLKHFGKNLQELKQGITTAHQATYRERPYTVKRRNQPRRFVQAVEHRPPAAYASQGRMGMGQGARRLPERQGSGGGTKSWVKKIFS